jgi:hypothetical protein
MGDIVLAGSTSGTCTLTPAAVSGTTVLTLPTANGTIVSANSSNIISVSGVQFPATQSASADANCLDDYEEGTWTPTITGAVSGSATIGSIPISNYIKIGRQVTIWVAMQSCTKNTLSGRIIISLPFVCIGGSYATGVMRYTGFTNMSTSSIIDPLVLPSTSTMFLQSKNATSYVVADLTDSNLSTNFDIFMINLTYETN